MESLTDPWNYIAALINYVSLLVHMDIFGRPRRWYEKKLRIAGSVFFYLILILIPDLGMWENVVMMSLWAGFVMLLFFLNILINYKYGFWIPYFDMAAMMLMMILPVIALKSYDFLSRHAALKTKVLLYEKEMEVCRQHTLDREYTLREFQRLGKSMEESLDRIETFVSENRMEEAVSYIRRLLSETGRSSYGLVSSGNMMIDGLVNYKASYIRALHIDFSAEIRIPADIEIQEENLCIILGNLLDNAVEGTEKVTES